jgi:hypothetical protein
VRVRVVSIGSTLNLGEFENLAHYDLLAQEIALAINAPTNAALVGTAILPMFLPATLPATPPATPPATGTAAAAGEVAAAEVAAVEAAAAAVKAVAVQGESGLAAGSGAGGMVGAGGGVGAEGGGGALLGSLAAAGLTVGMIIALVRRRRAHQHLHLRVSLVEGTLTAQQEEGMLGLRGSSALGRQSQVLRPVACWGSHHSSQGAGRGAEAAPAGRDGDYMLS